MNVTLYTASKTTDTVTPEPLTVTGELGLEDTNWSPVPALIV